MTTGWLCCRALAVSVTLAMSALAARAAEVTYADILKQLTDLDRLTRPYTGYRAGQYSSWDRGSREVWGANGDAGHYLRVEENGEAVMMDQDGPGVIYRIWSANPQGKIRIYLDGASTPTYEWDFESLFTGDVKPFQRPFVWRRGGGNPASDCYLPIPFSRHIKITADRRHMQYYHFNYLLYPSGTQLASFRLPLTTEEERLLADAARVWSRPGLDPKPSLPGQTTERCALAVAPGSSASLLNLTGPGIVRAIRARVKSAQRYAWRKLVLRAHWDGASWPQVLSPLGPLFGFDWEAAQYGSLIAGCLEGQAYLHFPMPFRRNARFALQSFLEQPAEVAIEIDWAPVPELPRDTLYYFARWRHAPDYVPFEYPFLETAGRGHFVGVAMPIDHPLPGWWGEGDEKVWVDDDDFPPWIGTGSEDYFGDAWGIRYLPEPSFGASFFDGRRTCNYRWHFMDLIPFERRFRMSIENYGPNGVGPRGHYAYSSVAHWYQRELTPPFQELASATYTAAVNPEDRPSKQSYDPNGFDTVDADSVRTYGLGLTYAQEAETLFRPALRAGRAKTVTDAQRGYELNRERAVDFGRVRAGHDLGEIALSVRAPGVYTPRIVMAPEEDLAEVALDVDGRTAPVVERPKPNIYALSPVLLAPGARGVRARATTDGRAIIDCIQLEPAARDARAIEAEDLQVVRSAGGEAPAPSAPRAGVSAGRVLEWSPGAAGASAIVRLPSPSARGYALSARFVRGPTSGVVQAYASGAAIGEPIDLYAERTAPDPVAGPFARLTEGTQELELRVVGNNPRSTGFGVAIDYLRLDAALVGEGSVDGFRAYVAGVHGCGHQIQDLGAEWSGGHHLWIMPSGLNAWVDIAIEAPQAGEYEIEVRYTTARDYAVVQASLDGKALGAPFDCFTEDVRLSSPVNLGRAHLEAGRHILRFQAVGRHPRSVPGYLMGIDHIVLRRAP